MGIFTWLEYLRAYSAGERDGRGVSEWQNVKRYRPILKHLDNNEEKEQRCYPGKCQPSNQEDQVEDTLGRN